MAWQFLHNNNPFGSMTQHCDETVRFHLCGKFELWQETIMTIKYKENFLTHHK